LITHDANIKHGKSFRTSFKGINKGHSLVCLVSISHFYYDQSSSRNG